MSKGPEEEEDASSETGWPAVFLRDGGLSRLLVSRLEASRRNQQSRSMVASEARAAVVVQVFFRGVLERRALRHADAADKDKTCRAATVVQALVRGVSIRKAKSDVDGLKLPSSSSLGSAALSSAPRGFVSRDNNSTTTAETVPATAGGAGARATTTATTMMMII